ncbi:hypothetical protein SEUCBS139899_010702 [Sporothrix eucalyptigena]|uniref:Heterokaryon incompatibility domain-containing protein n=1 Tax=Sporothrix eucalyptigena TaxID=1812306 RepID=A0ABP0D349_9PEZI
MATDVSEEQAVCPACSNIQPNLSSSGPFNFRCTRGAMRAAAEGGCAACAMILSCTSHYYRGSNEDTDDLRFGGGLVVHGDYLGGGVRIHTLLGDSETTPESLAPWTIDAAGTPLEHPTLDNYVAQLQGMFHNCTTEHDACKQATATIGKTPFHPTRLLDISGNRVRLVETTPPPDTPPPDTSTDASSPYAGQPYIALSHCWGENPPPTKTLHTNKAGRLQDIPWEELTQTFQDVVTLARRLGVLLVWIDSLCIVQDDADDWAHEASQMASVYQHAYFTIAATAAANGGVGLFSRKRLPVHSYRGKSAAGKPFTVYARPILDHSPFRRPVFGAGGRYNSLVLLTRGWCFQEQLLCPRVVHFTSEELVWDCYSGMQCECAQNDGYDIKIRLGKIVADAASRDEDDDQEKQLHDQLSTTWSIVVDQYTYRRLTFVKDRLPALSGLAAFYEQLATGKADATGSSVARMAIHSPEKQQKPSSTSLLGKYLAGLWENDLPFSLLWVCKNGPGERPRQALLPGTDEPPSSPPTWSWASVDRSNISFQRWNPPTPPDMFASTEILRTSVVPSTSDPRGMVAGGRLTACGPVARMRLQQFLISRDQSPSSYKWMQYHLSYDTTAGPVFQKAAATVVQTTGTANTAAPKVLTEELSSPKTVAALQPDVQLDPLLDTVWFLNLVRKPYAAKEIKPGKKRQLISGIFLKHTTRTAAAITADEVLSADYPVFERLGVGAILDDAFDEHSTTETLIIE